MGTQFGKYQLLKKIAAGGMAEIHLAKQRGMEGFEKIVVIKMILPNLANNEEFVQMFLDEARLAAKLTHPNIVQIFDLGRAAGTYFIAMEYIQGENLRAISKACRKRKQVVPLEHTVKIISQACEGLYHAHTKTDMMGNPLNVVHRDISPQNILVSFEGMTKIVDFGIAKATTQYQETRSGVLKGKYAYMSPEQCLGRHIDARSDLFSLGIVLWELATGVRLFKKKSELIILKEITEGEVTPPRQINQQVPAELEAIILKALEKNPDDRFQDALQMHLALEEFMKNQGIMSSTVHLSAFMRDLFKDKLDSLRKIERAQKSGETLESFLFDDVDLGSSYDTGTGTGAATPSQPSSISPSQPIYPRPTTGISRVEQLTGQAATSMATQASGISGRRPQKKSPLLLTLVMLLLFASLGVGGYVFYDKFFGGTPHDNNIDAGVVPQVQDGSIVVTSSPSGAKVFVDGEQKCITPCSVKNLKIGTFYNLEVSKAGYSKWPSHFKLDDPGEERSFNARLKKANKRNWGRVKIDSSPSGASIELDGQLLSQKTPANVDRVTAGANHSLRVFMQGRKDWTKSFTLKKNETLELSAVLEKVSVSPVKKRDAVFSLQSRPRGASFYLDGRSVGSSIRLRPGKTYSLSATMSGYEKWSDTIRPTPGEKRRIVARLIRSSSVVSQKTARLFVDSKPWSNVFIDGKSVGQTPVTNLNISAGNHTLRLVNPDLNQTKTVSIQAKPGQTIRKRITFSTSSGKLLVRAKPWADVYVDGKKIGTTPLAPKALSAGKHTVRLYNPTLDQEKTKIIQIKAGKIVKVEANFLN